MLQKRTYFPVNRPRAGHLDDQATTQDGPNFVLGNFGSQRRGGRSEARCKLRAGRGLLPPGSMTPGVAPASAAPVGPRVPAAAGDTICAAQVCPGPAQPGALRTLRQLWLRAPVGQLRSGLPSVRAGGPGRRGRALPGPIQALPRPN